MVPRYLEEPDPTQQGDHGDFGEPQGSIPTVVVCTGDLVEQARYFFFFPPVDDLTLDHVGLSSEQLKQNHIPFFSVGADFSATCRFCCWTVSRASDPL